MNYKKILVLVIVFSFLLSDCKFDKKSTGKFDFGNIDLTSSGQKITPDFQGEGLPIFYNMYLNVELSSLFNAAGVVYKADLVNAPGRTSSYLTSAQKAANLGVYAVDLCYAQVLDQMVMAEKHFNAMRRLSRELGIPAEYFDESTKRFKANKHNKDSLIKIANEIYMITNQFLIENEQTVNTAIIIAGGWVEAVYLATDIAIETGDPDIIERLMDQKHSLNQLISMLSEYKGNEVVQDYIGALQNIKKEFDKTTVTFQASFVPNSDNGRKFIKDAVAQLRFIGNAVNDFREDLVR